MSTHTPAPVQQPVGTSTPTCYEGQCCNSSLPKTHWRLWYGPLYQSCSPFGFSSSEFKNVVAFCSDSCLVTESRLFCDPVDYSPPGLSVRGILQAKILEWVAISSSGGSSQSRDWTHVFCTTGRFFAVWPTVTFYLTASFVLRRARTHTSIFFLVEIQKHRNRDCDPTRQCPQWPRAYNFKSKVKSWWDPTHALRIIVKLVLVPWTQKSAVSV